MNGFAMYTTWTVVASLINLTTSLTYTGGTDMKASRPFVQCSPAWPDPDFFSGSYIFIADSIPFLPDPELFCRIGPFLPDLDPFCRIRAFLPDPYLFSESGPFCRIRTFLAWSVSFLLDPYPFNRIRTYFAESGSVCRIRNFMPIQNFFVKSGDQRHIIFCYILKYFFFLY